MACVHTYIHYITHMHIAYAHITACIWTCTHKCMHACVQHDEIVLYTQNYGRENFGESIISEFWRRKNFQHLTLATIVIWNLAGLNIGE